MQTITFVRLYNISEITPQHFQNTFYMFLFLLDSIYKYSRFAKSFFHSFNNSYILSNYFPFTLIATRNGLKPASPTGPACFPGFVCLEKLSVALAPVPYLRKEAEHETQPAIAS